MSEESLNTTDAVGPSGEIDLIGMSPLELNRVLLERGGCSRSLGSMSFFGDDEEERKLSLEQQVRKISSRTWKSILRIVDRRC